MKMKLLDVVSTCSAVLGAAILMHGSAWAAKPTKAARPAETVEAATPEQLAAAERVYYGTYDCEFGQKAEVATLPKHPGYVEVRSGKSVWMMKPVASHTGAIRLEEVKGRYLVVQIASKSMLLNTKTGQRVLDACVNATQHDLIEKAAAEPAAEAGAMLK